MRKHIRKITQVPATFPILPGNQQDSVVSSAYEMSFIGCLGFSSLWLNQFCSQEVVLTLTDGLTFLFCLRDPQDWSDARKHLVVRKHQPDRLLPCELWPPELETAHSAAPQQPSGKRVHQSVVSFSVQDFFIFIFHLFSNCRSLLDHLRREQGGTYWRCL